MKKIVFAVIAFYVMTVSAQSQTSAKKILVAYFTMPESGGVDAVAGASRLVIGGKVSGNVEFVANCIQKATGGDMFAIGTMQTYPGEHQPLLEAAQHEQKANARPGLAAHITGLQNYDTIFIGYPIWWYDMPMPLYSFFDEYNFAGKTIIPFIVHGGGGVFDTIEKIIALESEAAVSKESFVVSRNNAARCERDVTVWLHGLGMVR
jgi:flavodoxin